MVEFVVVIEEDIVREYAYEHDKSKTTTRKVEQTRCGDENQTEC
jgi:hypothetical protein